MFAAGKILQRNTFLYSKMFVNLNIGKKILNTPASGVKSRLKGLHNIKFESKNRPLLAINISLLQNKAVLLRTIETTQFRVDYWIRQQWQRGLPCSCSMERSVFSHWYLGECGSGLFQSSARNVRRRLELRVVGHSAIVTLPTSQHGPFRLIHWPNNALLLLLYLSI